MSSKLKPETVTVRGPKRKPTKNAIEEWEAKMSLAVKKSRNAAKKRAAELAKKSEAEQATADADE